MIYPELTENETNMCPHWDIMIDECAEPFYDLFLSGPDDCYIAVSNFKSMHLKIFHSKGFLKRYLER